MNKKFLPIFTLFILLKCYPLSTLFADHYTLSTNDGVNSENIEPESNQNSNELNRTDIPIEDQYYYDALKSIEPLSPEQIKSIRRELDLLDRAKVSPITETSPITRSINLSLLSGETPFSINVAPGWVSTLTFSDRTGEPWPVQNVTNGNPEVYDVISSGSAGNSNIITISAKQAHIPTNIAILLQHANVPLLATLTPSQHLIDYRIDIRVDQLGPNASPEEIIGSGLPPTNDQTMLAFLDVVVPPTATALEVLSHINMKAWNYEDLMYIRTNVALISPAYSAKLSNSSGVNVYALQPTPILLVSDHGQILSVTINLKK